MNSTCQYFTVFAEDTSPNVWDHCHPALNKGGSAKKHQELLSFLKRQKGSQPSTRGLRVLRPLILLVRLASTGSLTNKRAVASQINFIFYNIKKNLINPDLVTLKLVNQKYKEMRAQLKSWIVIQWFKFLVKSIASALSS
jgi:hypothetical protein